MTRRYRPEPAISRDLVTGFLQLAVRAPSAGFSQGWDFVVLDHEADRERFWQVSAPDPEDSHGTRGGRRASWLAGMRAAPVLVLCLSDPERYLERYAEPDKGWTDRDRARWPVPFWDVDVGMAALLVHLAAVDAGLGSCLFGVPADRHAAVLEAFDIPADRRPVAVVSLGHAAPERPSPSLRRGRRPLVDVVHDGRFGRPWPTG